MNKIFLVFIFCIFFKPAHSQELRARVTVISNRVGNSVDKKTFQTLQTALNNFVNNRKWSGDQFAQKEKIKLFSSPQCFFILSGRSNVNSLQKV